MNNMEKTTISIMIIMMSFMIMNCDPGMKVTKEMISPTKTISEQTATDEIKPTSAEVVAEKTPEKTSNESVSIPVFGAEEARIKSLREPKYLSFLQKAHQSRYRAKKDNETHHIVLGNLNDGYNSEDYIVSFHRSKNNGAVVSRYQGKITKTRMEWGMLYITIAPIPDAELTSSQRKETIGGPFQVREFQVLENQDVILRDMSDPNLLYRL